MKRDANNLQPVKIRAEAIVEARNPETTIRIANYVIKDNRFRTSQQDLSIVYTLLIVGDELINCYTQWWHSTL